MKKALITGVTGQDGSYLSEFLLDAAVSISVSALRTWRASLTSTYITQTLAIPCQ